jgi:GNAT superfamily N-acetyltransferase
MPRIWLAHDDDADAVASLIGAFRDWWGNDRPADADIRATVERLIPDPATEYLLAAPDGEHEPAGVAQLRYRLSVWTGADDCWLEDLFVRESARGTGLGRALVQECLAAARARGCKRIELDVQSDNAGALALYESCGFSATPKGPVHTYFMSRRLD